MNKRIKYISVSIVSCVAILALGFYIFHWEFRPSIFEIYFFNLNRGHSVFIRTTNGKTILIDGGQTSEIVRELTGIFPFYRRRIDEVIVTSAVPKNVGGLVEVAGRYEIGKVIEPEIMGTSTALEAFEKIVTEKKIPEEKVKKGDSFEVGGVKFSVLFPNSDFKFNKTNQPELVLKIDFKDTTFLLLGDVSKTIQKSLIPELEKVHLVEFSNGATKSRVSADLLSKIDPDITVTSKREATLRFEIK